MAKYLLKRILPDEYQRVEYLEGTGTQYIDCGFAPSNNTNIEIKYQYPSTDGESSQYRVFGSRGNGSSDRAFFIGKNIDYWYINYNDSSNAAQEIIWGYIDTNIHTVKNSGSAFYFDNVNVITFADATFTSPYNAVLFGGNSKGTIIPSKTRVYYCKAYNGSTLIRDYVPCYRKSDSVAGMYDLANNVFYTNAGTGTFVVGNDATQFIKQRVEFNLLSNQLPSEYQQVEYIESTGTEYIDTNYIPSGNSVIVLDYRFLSVPSALSYQVGCGGTDNTNRNRANFGITYNNRVYLGNGSQQTLTDISTSFQTSRHIIRWDMPSQKIQLDSTTYSDFETFNTTGRTFYIFGRNQASDASQYLHDGRFYSMTCYENNIIVRNYIPCYRKSDNVIGMYDTVNNVFYTNAGTGTFTKGGDVDSFNKQPANARLLENKLNHNLPDTYQELEYIERLTTQYIDTGLSYTSCKRIVAEIELPNITTGSAIIAGWYTSGTTASSSGVFAQFVPIESGGIRIRTPSGGWKTYGSTASRGVKYKVDSLIKSGEQKLYVNDELIYSATESVSDSSNTVAIASRGASDSAGALIIYSFKCYDGSNTLLRNYIPCYRKSDGVAGLYDLVTSTFYTNAETGNFIYLPADYQKIKYLKSTGTQYINTGVNPSSNNFGFDIDFDMLATEIDSPYFLGTCADSVNYIIAIYESSSTSTHNVQCSTSATGRTSLRFGTSENVKANITVNSGAITAVVNGETQTGTCVDYSTNSNNFTLFARNNNGTADRFANMRLYRCKFYNSSALVRDLIPCYRKSDDVAGMFDLVNATFYTNSGTGEFEKGPDINFFNILKI